MALISKSKLKQSPSPRPKGAGTHLNKRLIMRTTNGWSLYGFY